MKNHLKVLAIELLLVILTGSCSSENCYNQGNYEIMIAQYLDYWNSGQFENIQNLLCEDFELRMTPKFESEAGIDAFMKSVSNWRTAYPDFHITINEILYSNYAATVRWTINATNSGQGSHPPTGKRIEVPGISIIHFKDDKIKDEWIASNNYYWLQQLGFTLETPSFDDK